MEEKRRIIKGEAPRIEEDKNKNGFLDYKNIPRKVSIYKGIKGNIKKYNKNDNKRNIINKKKNIYLIIAMIIFNLITPSNNMIEYKASNVILKIQGPGFRDVLSSNFFNNVYKPDIIYINGIRNFTISNRYYFNQINNTANLIWNDPIDNCVTMFRGCSDIIEMDLSNFDTSRVFIMNTMFGDCTQLSSLDVSNFKTSNVIDMGGMFWGCSKLSSLNLSKFDTSKVTHLGAMFYGCSQITSLDLSNFDTTTANNMESMFHGCSELSSLNLFNFDTSKVTIMQSMFYNCSNLSSLDVSSFKTSEVTSMGSMFNGCSKLSSLDVSNFDTSKVINTNCMFRDCSQLSSLDVSNFKTSNAIDMGGMFWGCSNLSSLNLSKFDTSKVTHLGVMFAGCSKMTSLDLSNFETSSANNMDGMFNGCSELSSLNLSNFDTSKVTIMRNMFSNCSKLEYINLKKFIEYNSLNATNIFNNISDNIVLCLNENSNNKILKELEKINCYTLDCSENWEINQKKKANRTDICFDISNNSILYNYEYNGLFYENCINSNLINNSTINYCQCKNEKCSSCSNFNLIDLKDNLYEIENDGNPNGYRRCYKDLPIGYYLDADESIYKKCYHSCKS